MIFIDWNVPMYLIGAHHPNKDRAIELVDELIRDRERFVTDVEVHQEIPRRYTAIRRTDAIGAAFGSLDAIVDEVLPFGMPEILVARTIIESVDGVSARDALHVAVMRGSAANRDRQHGPAPGAGTRSSRSDMHRRRTHSSSAFSSASGVSE